jgi:hypothetical protein
MYAADLVIGAGGTMTREAALLGIPTYTLFAGETPAVDRWLERRGLLRRLADADELDGLGPRPAEPRGIDELARSGAAARDAFVAATLSAATHGPGQERRLDLPAGAPQRSEGVTACAE